MSSEPDGFPLIQKTEFTHLEDLFLLFVVNSS